MIIIVILCLNELDTFRPLGGVTGGGVTWGVSGGVSDCVFLLVPVGL